MRGVAIGGFMAAGKSTVGRRLAERRGCRFVDLDERVAARAGRSVAAIFAEAGEPAFRMLEAQTLVEVLDEAPGVLALGGGTLHQPGNRERIQARMDLVVLDLSWEELEPRLREGSGRRPLAAEARRLWEQRREGYRQAGRLVDVRGLDVDGAADAVERALC